MDRPTDGQTDGQSGVYITHQQHLYKKQLIQHTTYNVKNHLENNIHDFFQEFDPIFVHWRRWFVVVVVRFVDVVWFVVVASATLRRVT